MTSGVGAVFTPWKWARWALEQLQVVDALASGATVCDPTAGEGVFALELAGMYQEKIGPLTPAVLGRIFLVDREPRFLKTFQDRFKTQFGLDFPRENLLAADVVAENPGLRFDLLVGNPPWVNFSDLEPDLKDLWKPWFVETGLVPQLKSVLLGGARIDLAALVLARIFATNAKSGCRAGFFLPTSLFLNDGAHGTFRTMNFGGQPFGLVRIYDFQGPSVFPGVSTRYCWAEFRGGEPTRFPVDYYIGPGDGWGRHLASPVGPPGSALTIHPEGTVPKADRERLRIEAWQIPRQGINTCGAQGVFVTDRYPSGVDPLFVYPLATAGVLAGKTAGPEKYIVLPYHPSGKLLGASEMEETGLAAYFQPHRTKLEGRKGVLIRSAMARGAWWALLGVGPYCFTGYKVIWQAYGGTTFQPQILGHREGRLWQANQAMQAFIPAGTWEEADRICSGLAALDIGGHLRAQQIVGTCNWAQPGRIKRFLDWGGPA